MQSENHKENAVTDHLSEAPAVPQVDKSLLNLCALDDRQPGRIAAPSHFANMVPKIASPAPGQSFIFSSAPSLQAPSRCR